MGSEKYRREGVGRGIYKLVRNADDEWVSTQVYYRTGDRKQHVKTFEGPNSITLAKKFKDSLSSKEPEQRVDPSLGRMTLGQVYDRQLASRSFSASTSARRADIRNKSGLRGLFSTPVARITRTQVRDAIEATTSAPGMAREIPKALSSAFGYATQEL